MSPRHRNLISVATLAGFVTLAAGSSPELAEEIAEIGNAGNNAGDDGSSTEWVQQLQRQTELRSGADYADMAGHGFSLVDVASTDLLSPGGNTTVPINLPLGSEYVVMGVCDNDCSDLDLAIFKGGTEISRDTSTDDWPVVQLTPTADSSYNIQVSMHACSHHSQCGYQLTVWSRPIQGSASQNIAPSDFSMSSLRGRKIWLVNPPNRRPCQQMERAGLVVECDPTWDHAGEPEIVIWCTEIPHVAAQTVLDHLGLRGFNIRTHQTEPMMGGTGECGELFEITVRWAD